MRKGAKYIKHLKRFVKRRAPIIPETLENSSFSENSAYNEKEIEEIIIKIMNENKKPHLLPFKEQIISIFKEYFELKKHFEANYDINYTGAVSD